MKQITTRRAMASILTLLSLGGAIACGKGEDEASDSASATTAGPALVLGAQDVAIAQAGEVGASITLSGPLEPKEQVTLRAQVGGTVQELRVDRGSSVVRGQRVARIQAAGVQSQAAGAQAQVAAAQANLAVARQRRDAAERLRAAGAMSEIDARSAVAQYEAAEAQLAAARAQLAGAGEAAGFTTIESPINGVVSDRKVEPGEAVNPGAELLTVVDSRTLELAGQVGVADAGRVKVGQKVSFALDAFPNEQFTGRVARIDPVANTGTRQVGVYVELPNPGGRIVGGQFARGSIATGAGGARGVLVPQGAVQRPTPESATGSVFVVENGRIARRDVTLGAVDEATGMVLVLQGVRAGERVIAVPSTDVREGTAVTLDGDVEATMPAAGTATGNRE
jgi:RND family efflux transporter MFP subunit